MFEGNKDKNKADIKKHIQSVDDLHDCLKHSAEHHKSYKIYYKNYEIVKKILNNKNLILRNDNYNDIIDENNIKNEEDGYRKFILCFSFSISESVAMWLVYSERKDNKFVRGAMIPYSSDILKKIVENNKEIEYGIFENDDFTSKGKTKDFKVEICDVIYYSYKNKNPDMYYIKRGDDVSNCPKGIIDELPYIKKNNAWNYENECRLIVKIKLNNLNKNDNAVRMIIPDEVIKNLKKKIVSSPLCANDGELKDSELCNQLRFK